MKNEKPVLDIFDKPSFFKGIFLSMQHLFAMFGATVLVPILVGLNPGIALFASGVGTLLHLLITKGQVPLYMGSSFAFITVMASLMKTAGYSGVSQGIIAVGVVYLVIALVIHFIGYGWVDKALPAVVVGPIVIAIGLSLASSAAKQATIVNNNYDIKSFAVAIVTLLLTIAFTIFGKGFISQIAVLLGIVCGYILSLLVGLVDFAPVMTANWLQVPNFEILFINNHPTINWGAILGMAPIAFVTMTEHMGHIMVLNDLTGRNFFKKPGLDRTLVGDGAASIVSGLVGGPAITSYGENIGVMAITKIHSVYVLIGAAVFAILFSFIGKLSALIQSIPGSVLGGVSFLLFGVIASSGLRILVENKTDFNNRRNLMIASSILVIGVGDAMLQLNPQLSFSGLTVATVIGIALNLVLPRDIESKK
ncbi:uracil-xanthine permease family protein [Holzapfeliella floricola]|nr:solute carrier family 23 protein [Holzapfeliella floricola]